MIGLAARLTSIFRHASVRKSVVSEMLAEVVPSRARNRAPNSLSSVTSFERERQTIRPGATRSAAT
ncbi:hypothetical protein D3C83_176220 [compost metagenome]